MTYPASQPHRCRVLHVGCGGDALPSWIEGEETRLDIDPAVKPDIVASMIDMGAIGEFDIVYCSHAVEHLYHHDVKTALKEFHRVLAPGGKAVVIVPDLEDVRPTDDVLYVSPAGPVTGLDMFFGMSRLVEASPYMGHRYGFTAKTLNAELREAGFSLVMARRLTDFNLLAIAVKGIARTSP